jgi:hypothetical protein
MSSGIFALQLDVPVAPPDAPIFVLQVTLVTPTLSTAVPWKVIEALEVESVPPLGEVITSEGGVVSGDPPWGAVCLVTFTGCET